MIYNPKGLVPYNKIVKGCRKRGKYESTYGRPSNKEKILQEYTNYPTTVLRFPKVNLAVHPTQKPVALLEYLVKTYTNAGETVLDNTMGSGSTGVVCVNTGRNFIGIEKDDRYFEVAEKRIADAQRDWDSMLFKEGA